MGERSITLKEFFAAKDLSNKYLPPCLLDLLNDHKSNWKADSAGGEPNHRPEEK